MVSVTPNPYSHAQELIEEHVEPSTKVRANGVTSGLPQLREADSKPNLHAPKDTSGRLHRHEKWRSRSTDVDESDSLSDIDDVEVSGYLHNKKEMQYKRILWEAMNRDYTTVISLAINKHRHGRTQKRAAEPKKGTTAKKAAKTTGEMDNKKLQRPSSKINYDALKKLSEELEQDSEKAEIKGTDFDSGNYGDSQSEKLSIEVHKSGKNNYNEFEQDTNHSEEDDDITGECDENLYYGYEDGYGDEEDYNNDHED